MERFVFKTYLVKSNTGANFHQAVKGPFFFFNLLRGSLTSHQQLGFTKVNSLQVALF